MKYLIFSLLISSLYSVLAQEQETAQQKQMAAQMAKYMDNLWDATPEDGYGHLKILMENNGKPVQGAISLYGQYQLMAVGQRTTMTSFNPNHNGRFVLEEMEPGTYDVSITGFGEHREFSWSEEGIEITSGVATLITIDIP